MSSALCILGECVRVRVVKKKLHNSSLGSLHRGPTFEYGVFKIHFLSGDLLREFYLMLYLGLFVSVAKWCRIYLTLSLVLNDMPCMLKDPCT